MKRIVLSVLAGSLLVGSHPFAFGIGGISVAAPSVGVSAASLAGAPATNPAGSGALTAKVITVETVDELYDAVNNPPPGQVTIHAKAGTYILDPTKPNNGRLFLKEGMSLEGENQYQDTDGDGIHDPI